MECVDYVDIKGQLSGVGITSLFVVGSRVPTQGSRQGLSLTDHLTNPGMGLGQGMTSSAWHSGN